MDSERSSRNDDILRSRSHDPSLLLSCQSHNLSCCCNRYGLLLDPKAVTATKIESGGGALTLHVTTPNVGWELGGKQGSIDLAYTLLMGAAPMSSLRLHMELKEEKKK